MTNPIAPITPARPVSGARAAQILASRMPDAVVRREEAYGEETVYLRREFLVEAVRLLRDDPDAQYRMPVFVTAVDWFDNDERGDGPRFDVIYQFRSLQFNDVCRLVVQLDDADAVVPSLEREFAGMDWHERECFDFFGIIFEGHHDLRRILLPDDWEGHPLRKDYVSFGEPVAFTHNLEWALPLAERRSDMPGAQR